MPGISTHVLDTAKGLPAAGMSVVFEAAGDGGWAMLGTAATDADGRVADLAPDHSGLPSGTYRITFDTGSYGDGFYPQVTVVFTVRDERHHHVPLLLSPFGYTTYRGS